MAEVAGGYDAVEGGDSSGSANSRSEITEVPPAGGATFATAAGSSRIR
jgi:hypothetical protein